jgi:hypothetical protein
MNVRWLQFHRRDKCSPESQKQLQNRHNYPRRGHSSAFYSEPQTTHLILVPTPPAADLDTGNRAAGGGVALRFHPLWIGPGRGLNFTLK